MLYIVILKNINMCLWRLHSSFLFFIFPYMFYLHLQVKQNKNMFIKTKKIYCLYWLVQTRQRGGKSKASVEYKWSQQVDVLVFRFWSCLSLAFRSWNLTSSSPTTGQRYEKPGGFRKVNLHDTADKADTRPVFTYLRQFSTSDLSLPNLILFQTVHFSCC